MKETKNIIWKLLRQNISKTQFVGFVLANLVGLTIVLVGIQFYRDVRPVFNDEESFIRKDYLIITRAVTTTGTILGNASEFSAADIADLEAQDWCRQVGEFTSSDFAISASIGMDNAHAMRTQFFLESIPNEFIDVDAGQWGFNPGQPEVPVIISRDYLTLYNFGFAATQDMPKISEGQAGMIPVKFTFSGNNRRETIGGRIVGFSSRLNTVIVPDDFMRWANNRYGSASPQRPQRLIVEVSSPGDVKIEQYMDSHHYDVAGDKMSASKANYFLTLISSIVVAVGIIISLLSFFVLMLSIYLLLQKNTHKLQNLLMLGYSTQQVARPYIRLVIVLNAVVLVLSVILMLVARTGYLPNLRAFGVRGAGLWVSIAVGILIMAAISAGNVWAIKQKTNALWSDTTIID